MPTTTAELRSQAKECLELASRTNEYYAQSALRELARELNRKARQTERRERDRHMAQMAWR
jgi:RNA processing factor Prp31